MRELNRQRREASSAQATEPVSADAGMLNVPFLGNRALNLANRGRIDFQRPQVSAATIDEVAKRSGRLEAARLAFSRVRSGKNSPEERAQKQGGAVEQMKQQVGSSIIKSCWATLTLTLGHSIYLIDLLFFLGWASKYFRAYIPEVGMEWLPQQTRDLLPRSAVLPLKLGEIIAMIFITLFVAILDVAILSMIILILSVLMAVGAGIAGK